ncbi:hypothetical protein P7C73_g6280, partial [Tremellales sp. Uapishka_1]
MVQHRPPLVSLSSTLIMTMVNFLHLGLHSSPSLQTSTTLQGLAGQLRGQDTESVERMWSVSCHTKYSSHRASTAPPRPSSLALPIVRSFPLHLPPSPQPHVLSLLPHLSSSPRSSLLSFILYSLSLSALHLSALHARPSYSISLASPSYSSLPRMSLWHPLDSNLRLTFA